MMTSTFEKNLSITDGQWQPRENEIAVRLSESELQASRVIVSPWQTGLLIVDGVVKGRSVGKQDLRGFWEKHFPIFKSAKSIQVLLARNGLITLLVNAVNSRSQDGVLFDIRCQYKVEIENFEQFWQHFMQCKNLVLTEDLAADINRPLRDTIRGYASRVESSELWDMSVELGLRFVDETEPVLQKQLIPLGLRLVMIEPPQCHSETFGKAQQRTVQRRDNIRESRADLEFQREKYEIDQDAYELEKKIGAIDFEKQVDGLKLKASLEQVRISVQGRADVQRLDIRAGVQKALDEYLKGRRAVKEGVEDAEIERANKLARDEKERQHLMVVVEIERSIALSNLRNRYQLESLKHAGLISSIELEQKKADYEKQSQLERMQLESTLHNKRMVDEYTRESLLQKHGINLKIVEERTSLDIQLNEQRALSEEKIRQQQTQHAQDIADREAGRELTKVEKLSQIQVNRLEKMHGLNLEEQRQQAEFAQKEKEIELEKLKIEKQYREKSETELLFQSSPEQIRAAAEYRAAQLGFLGREAAKREALLREILQLRCEMTERNGTERAAVDERNQKMLLDLVARIQAMGEAGINALREVGLATARAKSAGQVELPKSDASQAELLAFLKQLALNLSHQE